MLGKRYENDGKPILNLSEAKLKVKAQIEAKLTSGQYQWEDVACCICAGRQFDPISMKDRYGFYMPVVVCRSCGLVQTNPRMTQVAYNDFYQQHYRKLYATEDESLDDFFNQRYRKGKMIYDFVSGLIKPGAKVYEIGCASGGILHYFRERGCTVIGVDLDEEYTTFGRSKYGLDLRVGTIADLTAEPAPDLVLYVHTLEHTLNPAHELSQVRSLMPSSGLFYVEVPGIKNLETHYRLDFLRFLQNAHTYHFSKTSLANLAQRGGFEIAISNEKVEMLLRKSDVLHDAFVNDYAAVTKYLRQTEWFRAHVPYAYQLSTFPKKAVRRLLRMVR